MFAYVACKRFHSVRKSSFHLPFRIQPLTMEAKITQGEKVSANSKLNITNSWSYHLVSKHHYSKSMANTFVNCLINKYKSFPYIVTQFFLYCKMKSPMFTFILSYSLSVHHLNSQFRPLKQGDRTDWVNFSNF